MSEERVLGLNVLCSEALEINCGDCIVPSNHEFHVSPEFLEFCLGSLMSEERAVMRDLMISPIEWTTDISNARRTG